MLHIMRNVTNLFLGALTLGLGRTQKITPLTVIQGGGGMVVGMEPLPRVFDML